MADRIQPQQRSFNLTFKYTTCDEDMKSDGKLRDKSLKALPCLSCDTYKFLVNDVFTETHLQHTMDGFEMSIAR